MGSYLNELDERKRQLSEQYPHWQIWYVPRMGQPPAWCARPLPLLQTESAEQLGEAIAQAEAADPMSGHVQQIHDELGR